MEMLLTKKFTIDSVRSEFEKVGYTLLSDEYLDRDAPLSFSCSNGHIHKISFGALRKGQRCAKCRHDKLRLNINFIEASFVQEGYTLLTKNYINSQQQLYYTCPEGHNSNTTWSNWSAGSRCRYCAGNVTHTLEFIKSSFGAEGYTLLSTEYKNQKSRLHYKCAQGHINHITWTDWYNGGYRCPTCYAIKISGSGNYNWQGGISFEPYCEAWKDKEYKKDIRERDGNRCLNPYCDSKGHGDLVIHHIDYNKKNCKYDNLVTVCRVCNFKANYGREWHTAWYQAVLRNRYNYKY